MNELELAERFNRELDGVFREGKSAAFGPDPAAMELAASLARADYSGESEIRESLRAKLVTLSLAAGGSAGDAALPAGPSKLFGWLPRDVFARAALAAACLLLVLIPILRRSGGTGKESVTAPAQLPAQRFEGRAAVTASSAVQRKAAVLVQARARAASTAAAPGVFNSIPMARPEGERINAFPIRSAGAGAPIILAKGREVRLANGSRIVLETEHAVITLERRVITPEELFERKAL